MQDRADATELLDAISRFLRTQSGKQEDRWLRFQLLVASNSLGILKRELELEEGNLRAEWPLLDRLLGPEPTPETLTGLQDAYRKRQEALCTGIREGAFDDPSRESALIAYLVVETTNRVRIATPAEL